MSLASRLDPVRDAAGVPTIPPPPAGDAALAARRNGRRPADAPTPRQQRLGRLWVAGVVLVLGCTVGLNVYMLRVSGDDPSFAVEPDYYAKALHWDDELAQRARNAALGWRVAPALETAGAEPVLAVTIVDSIGAPLDGAAVEVRAFPLARSAQVTTATLAPREAPGTYAAPLAMSRGGEWELRFTVARGAERFTRVARLSVPMGGAGGVGASAR